MRTRTRSRQKNITRNSTNIKPAIFVVIGVFLVLFLCTVFAILNLNNVGMVNGIYINGIDISKLTRDDAKNMFKDIHGKKMFNGVTAKYEDTEYTIELALADINYNIDEVLDEAYAIGRSGNIVKDNFNILKTSIFNKKYELQFTYEKENILKELKLLYNQLPNKFIESSYYIENNELILNKEKSGIILNEEKIIPLIEDCINDFNNEAPEINVMVDYKEANELDIEKIHKEIFVEPKDAHYVKEPFKIYPEVNGIDFAISNEKIKEILSVESEEYVIPLKITNPKITTANLDIDVFPDLLINIDNKYDVGNANRATNLKLAADKINGYIIAPNEVFSYNKVVGARTIAAGYKEAPIYSGGKVIDGLGGGICQISTILYDAVLYANLDIIERENHQFIPHYTEPGLDATVVYGKIDFKFKNTRNYPIKIEAIVKNGVAKINIYGIKENNEPIVELETKIIETNEYKTNYIENPKLEKGTENLIQSGVNGIKSETYKILKKGTEEISREIISKDKYDSLEKIIEKN